MESEVAERSALARDIAGTRSDPVLGGPLIRALKPYASWGRVQRQPEKFIFDTAFNNTAATLIVFFVYDWAACFSTDGAHK